MSVIQRRQEVASMYLRSEPQWRIAQHFGVHPGQISRDLRAIQKQWQEQTQLNLDEAKARELAKLDEVERQAWDAWVQSRKDAETMEVTGTAQEGGKGKPDKVKKITRGQAGDSRFLAVILDCVNKRSDILGLDAPRKLEHGGIDGGPIPIQLNDEQIIERARAIINGAATSGS